MLTFGELNDRHAAILISVVLLLVVLIAILFVLSVAEKLSKRYIILSGTLLMFEFASYFALYRCYYRIGVKGFPFIVYLVDNIPAIQMEHDPCDQGIGKGCDKRYGSRYRMLQ